MSAATSGVEALYSAGHWLLTAERFADAAVVFRTMAMAAPSDERCWLALGSCHEAIGQLEIAISLYEAGGSMFDRPRKITPRPGPTQRGAESPRTRT
jgi:tetratricopeptide (TPR) repeat protein